MSRAPTGRASYAKRLFVRPHGAERVSKALSLVGGDPGHFYREPLFGDLIETESGWILFDAALRPLDLTPAHLSLVVISHLHWDHSGGIASLVEAGVPVVLHADGLAWGLSGPADLGGGHVSRRVNLSETRIWISTVDATDLAQNLLDGVRGGSCASGTAADEAKAKRSLALPLALNRETDARLIPGHDQIVFNAIRHPPGGHRCTPQPARRCLLDIGASTQRPMRSSRPLQR